MVTENNGKKSISESINTVATCVVTRRSTEEDDKIANYKGMKKKFVLNGPFDKTSKKLFDSIAAQYGKMVSGEVGGNKVYFPLYKKLKSHSFAKGFYLSIRKVNNNIASVTLVIDPQSDILRIITIEYLNESFYNCASIIESIV